MLEADNIRVGGLNVVFFRCVVLLCYAEWKVTRSVRLCDEQQRNLTGFVGRGMKLGA